MYWITGLLGIALGAAPWVFNYTDNTNALWASLGLGALILLASAYKGIAHDNQPWEYWVAGLAGVAAIAAPFVLNFNTLTEALWTSVIIGGLVLIVSGYESFFAESQTFS